MSSDRFEAAAIIVDAPGGGGSANEGAALVVRAVTLLRRAGFGVVLLPPGASVRVRRSRPRWFRRGRRKEE